jgi:hypothetical protein
MIEMISYDHNSRALRRSRPFQPRSPRTENWQKNSLWDSDPGLVFQVAVKHLMETAHPLQGAGVLRIERAAQHEPVTVGPEPAEKVRQRAERDTEGRCCPRSVGEPSPTCRQYCSQGCS